MDTQTILKMQFTFGKTKSGRFIGKILIPIIKDCFSNLNASTKMIECSNCQLILSESHYSSGCKNCGSKDFKIIN